MLIGHIIIYNKSMLTLYMDSVENISDFYLFFNFKYIFN